MDDCSKHKKEVAGITDMKLLAEMVGDLNYGSLQHFLGHLAIKLNNDGLKDRGDGRNQLGYALNAASDDIQRASIQILQAWRISKPFMKDEV